MNRLDQYISPRRLLLCLRRDIVPNSRSFFVVLGSAVAFFFIISAMDIVVGDKDPEFQQNLFYPILFLGGFLFTSGIFKEVHKKESILPYLMLPASAVEKVLSRLLIVSIGWIVFSFLWFTAYTALSEGFNSLFFGASHKLFNPFTADVWRAAAHYVVLQSLFFIGAIYFRKLHFFKTVLSLGVFAIFLSIITGLLIRLVFYDYFTQSIMLDGGATMSSMLEVLSVRLIDLAEKLRPLKVVLYWIVVPLFSWSLVYIRFREVQVKDGI